MMKQLIIAGLMGTAAVAPAYADDADQRNGRWGARSAESNGNQQRYEARSGQRPNWKAREEQRQERREDRQDWNQTRRDTNSNWNQARRDNNQDWNQARVENNQNRDQTRQDWNQARRDNNRSWADTRRDNNRDWNQARRDNRKDWREDRRDNNRTWTNRDGDRRYSASSAYRNDRRDWRDNGRDWRNGRYSWNREWRRDQRYDWQRYRAKNRHLYRASRYYAPYGWSYGYRRFSIGVTLFSGLYGSNYWIDDPWYYRLPPAYGSLRWVRYYDDALLVDIRTGYVVDVIRDFFW
ncbi:MAG: RcnB family protein [Sphingobium sp.]